MNKHKMEKLLYKIVFFFVDIVQNTTLYKKLLNILYYFDNKHSVLKINTLTNNHSTYFDLILHANFQIFINDIVKNGFNDDIDKELFDWWINKRPYRKFIDNPSMKDDILLKNIKLKQNWKNEDNQMLSDLFEKFIEGK